MLYNNEDDEKISIISLEEANRKRIKKKAIICGVIIGTCIIVMIISIIVSVHLKNNDNKDNEPQTEKNNTTSVVKDSVAKENKYEHTQIEQHDLDKIKSKFVPQANPNAQTEITNIYYSDEKVAYLTFDDGPSKNITPQILDILKQENVTATFFVLGSRVELYPELVQREYNEGHYLANHGYSHEYSKIYQSKDTVFEEYVKCENAIRNALNNQNYNTYLFRFPGGSSGGRYSSVKSEAKELLKTYGVNYTNWNCMTGDAEGKNTTEALMNELISTMEGDGSIIVLMHDASDKTYTVEALPSVISYLKEQGYVFKNFYEIF